MRDMNSLVNSARRGQRSLLPTPWRVRVACAFAVAIVFNPFLSFGQERTGTPRNPFRAASQFNRVDPSLRRVSTRMARTRQASEDEASGEQGRPKQKKRRSQEDRIRQLESDQKIPLEDRFKPGTDDDSTEDLIPNDPDEDDEEPPSEKKNTPKGESRKPENAKPESQPEEISPKSKSGSPPSVLKRTPTIDMPALDSPLSNTGPAENGMARDRFIPETPYEEHFGPTGPWDFDVEQPYLFEDGFMRSGSIFAGVTGFTGPVNRGSTGSFGFTEGGNVSGRFLFDLGWQAGARVVHSNLSGADFTQDSRTQLFGTAGLFRRVDWGLQYGLALDYLHDDWNYKANLEQLRGEIGWQFPTQTDVGFWFTAGVRDDERVRSLFGRGLKTLETDAFRVTDIYAFYARRQFHDLGAARLSAGFTSQSHAFVGADATIPVGNHWALQTSFSYLVPRQGPQDLGFARESWNLSLQIVWYPGCRRNCGDNYYMPLFDVADNGRFFVDRNFR